MDGQRFDEVMRALGAGVTRRRGLLAGLGALASALAAGAAAEAAPDAQCKPNRMECKGGGECCSGACRNGWCAPQHGRGHGKGGGKDKDKNKGGGNGGNHKGGGKKPKPGCAAYAASCANDGDCCAGMGCDAGHCKVDCPAALEARGCSLNGNGTWNCGNTGGHAVDLSGANVSGCDLTNASFFQTDCSGAAMTDTVLTGANFNDATVTGVAWDNTTCPGGTNSDANGGTCCGAFAFGQVPTGCGA